VPILLSSSFAYAETEIECLARNAYFEARNAGFEEQVRVTQVVLNRVADDRWPASACKVIYARARSRSSGRIVCQFSWYCDGKSDRPKELYAWEVAKAIALLNRQGTFPDFV